MLAVRDVTVAFDGHRVLDAVSLGAAAGEVVALLGASGSGKSTLLRVIAGLIDPDAGTVSIAGEDVTRVPTHRRGVGLVFQDEQLFPHRDVAANIAFGLRMQGADRATQAARVKELLVLVGLPGFASRAVTALSGGEAKRVALARSLAPGPRVLLLDEPLTGLDRELHDRLAGELAAILRASGTTAILVTHDQDEAAAVADRVVSMEALGAGPVVVELAAAETHRLRGAVLRHDTPSGDVVLPGDDDPTTLHLGVRDAAGRVVATSTWLHRAAPRDLGGSAAVQLRMMATDPAVRGTGLAARLVEAGVARAFAAGADLVWANARDTAIDFYRGHGFDVAPDGFLDETTGLPHHVIWRRRA